MANIRTIAGSLAILAFGMSAGAAIAQQQGLSETEAKAVKEAATATVQKYYQHFRDHNMKALPEESFNIPWIQIGGQGPRVDLTKEQALAGFEGSLKQLLANGWGKSEYTVEGVCALNANAAIVSGYNTRYKTDGSVMSVGGTAYIVARTPDGWKIVSYTGVTKGKPVAC